jgi:ATP-dependent Clp protease adaptor protein ClpS
VAEREEQRPGGSQVDVAEDTRARTRLSEPPRFKVLLHNDHYTTQEFVIWVLQNLFHHGSGEAFRLMLQVHTEGLCVAGVYPAEIAEAKAAQVCDLARQQEFPFLATTEPA